MGAEPARLSSVSRRLPPVPLSRNREMADRIVDHRHRPYASSPAPDPTTFGRRLNFPSPILEAREVLTPPAHLCRTMKGPQSCNGLHLLQRTSPRLRLQDSRQ